MFAAQVKRKWKNKKEEEEELEKEHNIYVIACRRENIFIPFITKEALGAQRGCIIPPKSHR